MQNQVYHAQPSPVQSVVQVTQTGPDLELLDSFAYAFWIAIQIPFIHSTVIALKLILLRVEHTTFWWPMGGPV